MTLQLAMVGGGPGSFIGAIHRYALRIDGRFDLVAGAFSRDEARNRMAAKELGLPPERCYGRWQDLLSSEAGKIDAVAIVTPNDTHLPISLRALKLGISVLCEKPATLSLAEAMRLKEAVQQADSIYGLAHTYLAYPLVTEAKLRILRGDIGRVRRADVRYVQGWLSEPLEQQGNQQAGWRTDPEKAGAGGALGDIGTHAFSLLEFVTGQKVQELTGQVNTVVPNRKLDDDAAALLRLENGGVGTLVASQICAGEANGLSIRVYGEKGSLTWRQEQPDRLHLAMPGGEESILRAGTDTSSLTSEARDDLRTPSGHPEGYIEAFANLYGRFARKLGGEDIWMPGIDEGVRGLAFVEAMLASSEDGRPRGFDELIEEAKR
jgi:predicted dehydrogenase